MNLVLEHLDSVLAVLFLLAGLGLVILFLILGRRRSAWGLRSISSFRRIRREIGLAVEAGKRVHVSLGRGDINDLQGGATNVGLTTLDLSARAASMSDRPPVATSGNPVVHILSQDTLRSTYDSLGAERLYDPTNARLSGLTPLAYAAGAMPDIHDEDVSLAILSGHFGSEVGLLAEAGERAHSLTVGGSDSLTAQAVLYATVQEPLIGEELYASGAYLGARPAHIASLRAQDVLRWVLVAAILVGAALKLVGVWP